MDARQPQSDERTCGLLDKDVDNECDMLAAHKACCCHTVAHRPAMQQAALLAVVSARLTKETAWRCPHAMSQRGPGCLDSRASGCVVLCVGMFMMNAAAAAGQLKLVQSTWRTMSHGRSRASHRSAAGLQVCQVLTSGNFWCARRASLTDSWTRCALHAMQTCFALVPAHWSRALL